MTFENVARVIQYMLAPVVMVTACSLIANGLMTRYGTVNDRLRTMARERLDLLHDHLPGVAAVSTGDPLLAERLHEIDVQLPELLHRHRLIQDALLLIFASLILFIVSMFVIALATIVSLALAVDAVLILLLLGTGVLMGSYEIHLSNRSVHYEVLRIRALRPVSEAVPPDSAGAWPENVARAPTAPTH